MKRNMFGSPRPSNTEEIREAIEEKGVDPSDLNATMEKVDSDGMGGAGWSAEIRDNEGGDEVATTLAFPTRSELVLALTEAGISEDAIDEI